MRALAIMVSGCIQIVLLIEPSSPAVALAAQKRSTSSNDRRDNQNGQLSADQGVTRPRRAEWRTEGVSRSAAGGPLIRVGLMTDVSSVALGSSSGLIVRSSSASLDEAKPISSRSLTVELRQQREAAEPLRSGMPAYRVSVGSSTDSRGPRKIAEELKKKFFEPVATTFDENQKEYSVLIGQFGNRGDAAQFLERLRKSGYESLRIVSEQRATHALASNAPADQIARTPKYKTQPGSAVTARPNPERKPIRLIALAGGRIAASSDVELAISPAGNPGRSYLSSQPGDAGVDQRGKHVIDRDQSGTPMSDSEEPPVPASVRIGDKDYRGEIRLVLNPRGRINVVNALPLEDYLRGVVPLELSPGAYPEIEALKAQAVAARSYALARMGRRGDEGFDLVDDTRDQVYGGLSAERDLTNRAVDETRGIAVVFPNENGALTPIEALYTANCGGRTENNEEVFGGAPLPYLRAVACMPDGKFFASRDIVSGRGPEPLIGIDGRSIAREVALLSVLGFPLPRRLTSSYLSRPPDKDEVRIWIEQTARLTQREPPRFTRGDPARLAEFSRLVSLSAYGEGRASTLLAPADVDYLLSGLRLQGFPRETRADVAMLSKDGILRLPSDAVFDGGAQITRGQAIETLARAISTAQTAGLKSQTQDSRSQSANPKLQSVDSKSQISSLRVAILKSETAAPSENGRLIISGQVSTSELADKEKGSRFVSLNAVNSSRLTGSQYDEPAKGKSSNVVSKEPTAPTISTGGASRGSGQARGIEIAEDAWLFRSLGGALYQVDRLTIIGRERVVYHLNARGQVDFLEASPSDRSASSDRFSSVAQWQERIPIEELQQRLARFRINVGRIDKIEPVSFSSSSRVTEVEVTGDERSALLRRPQLRAALGLKEYLFVVDRETDSRGQVVAFLFTGRGWGHGVGMCQTGAYGLAKEGYSYAAILQKYYTGVTLQRLY